MITTPDTGTICALFDMPPGRLAEVFYHEATHELRRAAQAVDDGLYVDARTYVGAALWALQIADAFDEERELSDAANPGGTEATSRTPGPPQSPTILAGSES